MALATLVALLGGCDGGGLHAIPGTTVRVAEPESQSFGVDHMTLEWLATEDDCAAATQRHPEELADCRPFVDRGTGQVRLSFRVRLDTDPWPVLLEEDQLQAFHKNRQIIDVDGGRQRIELVPHEPVRSPQLFVLLIDISGSMNIVDAQGQPPRIEKVRQALLRRDVVDAFFPPDTAGQRAVATAVLPLVFAGAGPPQPLLPPGATDWAITRADDYREVIRTRLASVNGYTYLYSSIRWSVSTLLERPEVKQLVQSSRMQPTVVALTDGFNNERPEDICADNALRLSGLLKVLDRARREAAAGQAPLVYTVGLGRPAHRDRPHQSEVEPLEVTAAGLCRQYPLWTVDGGVERLGVDNEALGRIARVGGGATYIRSNTEGLAEAFKAAAATRYEWYELRYQVDPFYLRRSFTTRLRLLSLFGLEASMEVHPSGWLDAPPGVVAEDGWARPAPYRATLGFLLPVLGALVVLGYLPAALHNGRRPFRGRAER